MNYTWSLDKLYPGFDEPFKSDVNHLKSAIAAYQTLSTSLNETSGEADLYNILNAERELMTLSYRLIAFCELRLSTNTTDSEANAYAEQLDMMMSQLAKSSTQFSNWLSSKQDDLNTWASQNQYIKEHEFILKEIIERNRHQLSEDVEEVIAKMSINGSSSWSNLQSYLTSVATIEFNGKEMTLSEIRNLAYDEHAEVRKTAYQAELELYQKIKGGVAFSLNSIKGEVNTLCDLRGYSNALQETLQKSRMSQKTLDALLQAIEEYLPVFRKYLRHKATLLGHENGLPWYDLFAPIQKEGKNAKVYSIEDSHAFICETFATFSADLAGMADDAYTHQWIDFLPYSGKQGGAFCFNLPIIKESRILSNYNYSIGDVVTLAHELGHAYHGYLIQDGSILNSEYTMPVAETASTFCENIVFNAALAQADKDEQITLIENSLQDLNQIIVDIYARYLFESAVIDDRKSAFLFPEQLEKLMQDAQIKAYGDGLDQTFLNPLMWICKSHYYSAENNFYNFPYAYGGLFALGLYGKFQNEGASFVPLYQKLLKATTTHTCEEVAAVAGIDVSDVAFWRSSLTVIEKRIDQFIELTSQ